LGPEFSVVDVGELRTAPTVEETGSTFEENARLKANTLSRLWPGWVVADDSGLEVAALGGAPGVYSARYAGDNATDRENILTLLRALQATGGTDRRARFHCAIALARGGETVAVFHGTVEGSIALSPKGMSGFGYDPVFVPNGYAQTFAELGELVKNKLSHRARAVAQLREDLLRRSATERSPERPAAELS
ncbi:MAG TPA: RdgB/HAM1 family non-canonical purine NTP pyrophosphatase, partial [Chthoniobacterales bacterium]|nr:RdgB/HAM1 family non-canonical purine NTP pyrophosphatase [Chthoniobacterales bacterium]